MNSYLIKSLVLECEEKMVALTDNSIINNIYVYICKAVISMISKYENTPENIFKMFTG